MKMINKNTEKDKKDTIYNVSKKVCLIILSSFTVIFLRFDRLRIKYNNQILACRQKQRCG